MIDLFQSADDLRYYLFRITDNGGETYDRITVTFSDGDAMLCTSGSICAHIESVDVQRDADDVEAGQARDLRWIDLDEGLQRRIIASLNEGFGDWFNAFDPPGGRKGAVDYGTGYRLSDRIGEGVYGKPGAYYVRRESYPDRDNASDDLGPYETLREAVLATLPDDYDLSGPEYHTTVDLWDTEGGPAPLWDREADPPPEVEE